MPRLDVTQSLHGLWPRGLLITIPLLLLAGCGSGDNAAVRLLNVSQDYASLNIYVGSSSTTPAIAAVPTGNLSSYSGISPGSDTLYFTSASNTQTDALTSETETFTSSEHRTYVTYGDTGEFAEYEIDENESAPSGDNASVEVLNTASDAGALDVYLTTSGTSLASVSPNFSNLATGKATSFTSIASGTYELSVTGTGNNSDVRLQAPSITLNSQEVATIIITESAGGYLVNAYILPQQGSLTTELNPDARVRAVVGLTSGSDVSATVGSTVLLNNAPITSIGTYQLVPVGNESVSVTVAGSAVSSPAQALAAGQDYTFLVYQNASGTQENWLVDTNRLPLSGDASVRLVHAMSGLTDPISLSVDYVPVATEVSQGNASSYDTGVAATTTGALGVTDTTTSQPIYSQSSVTLSSQGVYTLFMFGSASSANGVLNQDR
jgi:hypothetical protein